MKTQRETAAITQQKQKVIPYKTTTMQARKKIWPVKQQGFQQKKFKIVDHDSNGVLMHAAVKFLFS